MKILISGGAGFIGYHLACKFVKENHNVILIDNLNKTGIDSELKNLLKNENIKLLEINLENNKQLLNLPDDFEIVIHLAAILGVQNVINNSFKVLDSNVKMLSNMLELAQKQKRLYKFLFASTSEVYAGTLEKFMLEVPTPEDSNIILPDLNMPRTSYMLSKIYGEAMCIASGLPLINIRPHNIYGPRMGSSHVIPQIIKRVVDTSYGGKLGVYSPNHTRVFCYVDDATSLIYKLLFSSKENSITINLGNNRPEIKIHNLVKKILTKMNREDIQLFDLPATEGSPSRRAPNIDKLTKITDLKDRLSIDDGLEKTIKWYLEFLKINSLN